MPGGNQLWLKDFEQRMDVSIDFTFEGSTNFVVEKHPNSELFAVIDKEQVKKSIIEADLSKPYFTLLDVPVPLESWDAFTRLFCPEMRRLDAEGARGMGYLAAAVRSFFEQGGRRCYVVRVGRPWGRLLRVAGAGRVPLQDRSGYDAAP